MLSMPGYNIVQNTVLAVILLLCLWRVLRQFAPNLARRLHLMAAQSSAPTHGAAVENSGCGSCGQSKNDPSKNSSSCGHCG